MIGLYLTSVRAKYEHQIREVEYAKTKAVGELDEEIEVLKSKLRHEEKTSAELKEELENKETDLAQAKKRNQRLLAELHDTKVNFSIRLWCLDNLLYLEKLL